MRIGVARIASLVSAATLLVGWGDGPVLSTATLDGADAFITSSGLTVYVFDFDLTTPQRSACNDSCATSWPPAPAPDAELQPPWSSIRRADGRSQLVYAGHPLYTFAGDTVPGQMNGDGVRAFGGVWHVARPALASFYPAPMEPELRNAGGGGY